MVMYHCISEKQSHLIGGYIIYEKMLTSNSGEYIDPQVNCSSIENKYTFLFLKLNSIEGRAISISKYGIFLW